MKTKKSPQQNRQQDLFRSELASMINLNHPLVRIANTVDWNKLDENFGRIFRPDYGGLAIATRLMISLHSLNYTFNLSLENNEAFKAIGHNISLRSRMLIRPAFIASLENALTLLNRIAIR